MLQPLTVAPSGRPVKALFLEKFWMDENVLAPCQVLRSEKATGERVVVPQSAERRATHADVSLSGQRSHLQQTAGVWVPTRVHFYTHGSSFSTPPCPNMPGEFIVAVVLTEKKN